ncbi:TPA: metallophosphoesterase [Bacillus cereus]|nr:metallophosphoesterase [Bacillus cereus]HDR4742439.1 metallophosphoesterase [Bacillus cereus]HDR4748026.1 metallophosphoesterase [Bacillus cereus]HDR4753500.1 metallophosphoesterase [Bacillus cereus]HDR4770709.1 metallophosphoesterase [Bacillus cereus]
MKIDYASDLHANHWMLWTNNQMKWESRTREFTRKLIENGNGEVLILPGDFSEWNQQSLWILDEAAKHYERVYFTIGNHDMYLISGSQKKKYKDSIGRINDLIEKASEIPNVVPLVQNVDTYKGKVFAGDVLWYLPKSQADWEFLRNVSNDSSYISINGYAGSDVPRKLHKESMDWYDTLEETHVDVFVSHVPPVHNPFTPFEPNTCYMTDVPFINADHWICGHDHIQGEFEKAGVQFHMNAIGYPDHYSNYPKKNVVPEGEIDEHKSFGIKTFEV